MSNQPISPRGPSKVIAPEAVHGKELGINAKSIFQNVSTEESKGSRVSQASASIEQLKDNRGFLEKLGGILVRDVTAKNLAENFLDVDYQFRVNYASMGIAMPDAIKSKFVSPGGALIGDPAFLDEKEVNQLKDLAYLGDQTLKFDKELVENPAVEINGDLKDVFEGRTPSDKELLTYTDNLKKLLIREKCVPELVVSDPDPRTFVFIVEGKGENQPPKLVKVQVSTVEDLDKLQENLKECGNKASGWKEGVGEKTSFTIKGQDPFGIKDKAAKKDVLEGFNTLGEDKRTRWDKFAGLFRMETAHAKKLKTDNQLAFTQLKIDFNRTVKGQSFKDVMNGLPQNISVKLNSGERLTDSEVKQLQAHTLRAMQEQRFAEDLKERVPAAIEGNLKSEFVGQTLDSPVSKPYLNKLKEELIRGGYPGLVTSDVDPRKFLFFKGEKLITVTVNSVKDLDTLEAELKACRDRAVGYAPKVDVESLENKNKASEHEIENLKKQLKSLESEHAKEIKTINKEHNKVVEILDAREARVTQLLPLILQRVKENEKMKQEIEVMKSEKQELMNEIEVLRGYVENWSKLVKEYDEERQELEQKVKELELVGGNIEYQKSVVQELQKNVQQSTADLEAKAQQMAEAEKKLSEVEGREDEILERNKNYITSLLMLGSLIGAGVDLKLDETEEQ